MSSVEQHKDKQPLVKPSAVVATGLAAAVGAFLTSRFGVAGTVLGTALTTMIITVGSALFEVSLRRVADKARSAPAVVVRVRPPRRTRDPPRRPLGRRGFVRGGHGHRHGRGAKRG
jgi:hypothetical protein